MPRAYKIRPALSGLEPARRPCHGCVRTAGLIQAEVAERLGRSVQTISRLEQRSSNPQISSLFRYLDAIGATLAELEAEMGAPADPLDEAVALVDQRLRVEPGYRRLAPDSVTLLLNAVCEGC